MDCLRFDVPTSLFTACVGRLAGPGNMMDSVGCICMLVVLTIGVQSICTEIGLLSYISVCTVADTRVSCQSWYSRWMGLLPVCQLFCERVVARTVTLPVLVFTMDQLVACESAFPSMLLLAQ